MNEEIELVNDRLDRIEAKLQRILKLLDGRTYSTSISNHEPQEAHNVTRVLPVRIPKEGSGLYISQVKDLSKNKRRES